MTDPDLLGSHLLKDTQTANHANSDCITLSHAIDIYVQHKGQGKGKQKISFQFGIYSWRIIDEGIDRFQDTPPPMVVAYYKNVGWKARN